MVVGAQPEVGEVAVRHVPEGRDPETEMKLKDDKTCQKMYVPGHVADDAEPVHVPCRFGYCTILLCPACGLRTGVEWGPIACPHKKRSENGTLRRYKYPDMDSKATHWGKKGERRR